MGRQSRRLVVRLAAVAACVGGATFANTRWQLRQGSAAPVDASLAVAPQPRSGHLRRLQDSSEPDHASFDILVVGGGIQGLYTAVDAAQRGLRVALVEANDYGSGATSQGPTMQPGAFPFVQRALRQRDVWWLRRAAESMREATIWENVCPEAITNRSPLSLGGSDASVEADTDATAASRTTLTSHLSRMVSSFGSRRPAALHTLIPALHAAELVEFSAAACLSTLLSPFCGPWRPHWLVPPQRMSNVLPGMDTKPHGGVRCCDLALHGPTAACALLRTAESLGVVLANHAPLQSMTLVQPSEAHNTTLGTSPIVEITVQDALSRRPITLRTRAVVNCAEAWVDQVRALCPGNEQSLTPQACSHYSVQSFLVVPRQDVYASAVVPQDTPSSAALLVSGLEHAKAEALQVCSTLYSFSAVFVLPWVNDCVLLGPCYAPIPHPPTLYGTGHRVAAGGGGQEAVLSSSDGFRAQQERVCLMLKSCGISVAKDRMLSCLSHVVPVLATPQTVPWTDAILRRGFHVDVARCVPAASDEEEGQMAEAPTRAAVLPFVHVYGGTLLQARLVAAAAVDAVLQDTHSVTASRKATLTSPHSRTAKLALSSAYGAAPDAEVAAITGSATSQPMQRLKQIIHDTHAERITDVLFRRTQVGYTSPAEAMKAATFVADCLPALAGASRAVKTKEVELACRGIGGVALRDASRAS